MSGNQLIKEERAEYTQETQETGKFMARAQIEDYGKTDCNGTGYRFRVRETNVYRWIYTNIAIASRKLFYCFSILFRANIDLREPPTGPHSRRIGHSPNKR
jgi:hypothetical protein